MLNIFLKIIICVAISFSILFTNATSGDDESCKERCSSCVMNTNFLFDCRPVNDFGSTEEENRCAIFCGICCFPLNVMWRIITCPWQKSMNCCDVICARCDPNEKAEIPVKISRPLFSTFTSISTGSGNDPYLAGGSYSDDLDSRIKSVDQLQRWVYSNCDSRDTAPKNYVAYILHDSYHPHYLTKTQAAKLVSEASTIRCKPRVEKR